MEQGRYMVNRRVEDEVVKATKLLQTLEEKRIRKARRVFEEVAKQARQKRLIGTLKPVFIVDSLGGGRSLKRG